MSRLDNTTDTIQSSVVGTEPFVTRMTADLQAEAHYLAEYREELQLHRLRLLEAGDIPSVEYIELRLTELLEELSRRKRLIARYSHDPLAPVWVNGSGKQLGELAQELKRRWPLHQFCRDMLLLKLTRSGDRYRACCPLHQEDTPSFVIYPDDRYHCFGCGEHGDIYELIGKLYGKANFRERVEMLARVQS